MPRTNTGVPQDQLRLAAEIRKDFGNMLTAKTVGEIIGVCDHKAYERWLEDVRAYIINGRKKYFAADVAQKLYRSREDLQ